MDLSKIKLYYLSLCLFFLIGGAVQAYSQGSEYDNMSDMSWATPSNFAGYLNSYLTQKVNPSTMADVLVTEYIHHPQEATGVDPVWPTQSIVHVQELVNVTITEIKTYIQAGSDYYGTIAGVALFVKRGDQEKWELLTHQEISTQGRQEETLEVTMELQPLVIGQEGGKIRIVVTNLGNQYGDVLYVPTTLGHDETITYSGVNTLVDSENALFLTITNRYRDIRGSRFIMDYKKHIGLRLHEQTFYTVEGGEIRQQDSRIVAIFSYPELERLDSEIERYSNHRSILDNFLSDFSQGSREYLTDLLIGIPIIGSLFKYSKNLQSLSQTTESQYDSQDFIEYCEGITLVAQSDATKAVQPALQTLIISQDIDYSNTEELIEEQIKRMDYFQTYFIKDYNDFEHKSSYNLEKLSYTKYLLDLSGERRGQWVLDISKQQDEMVTEINVLDNTVNQEGLSFRWLLNKLNQLYYSSKESGTVGINNINQRVDDYIDMTNSSIVFSHLVRLVQDLGKPDFGNYTVTSIPEEGLIFVKDEEGTIVSKYGMYSLGEFFGIDNPLLSSEAEQLSVWLTRMFGPWANLQVPDERPVDSWNDKIYMMYVDRDENDYFDPVINTSRPDILNIEGVGVTSAGWYMGNGVNDYASDAFDPYDHDWSTIGASFNIGAGTDEDIRITGYPIGYWTGSNPGGQSGWWGDNNGWIMYDLGDSVPETGQWRVSFDFKKTYSQNEDIAQDPVLGDWDEAGLGIALTSDVGIRELMERYSGFDHKDNLDLYIPLHIDGTRSDTMEFLVYDPVFITHYTKYGVWFDDISGDIDNPHTPESAHWPGGELYTDPPFPSTEDVHRYFHEGTITHNPEGSEGIERGYVELEENRWYHVDIYYDDITNLLNIAIDGAPVYTNIYIPELDAEAAPTLENVWFYNYGEQEISISNLEISDKVAPIPIPFRTSAVNIEDITTAWGMDYPLIPYFGNDPLWIEQTYNTSTVEALNIGQLFNLGLGADESIYWYDLNGDGIIQQTEYVKPTDMYVGKNNIFSAQYEEDYNDYYIGLKPLQGSDFYNFLDQFNYTTAYQVAAGALRSAPFAYPESTRDYSTVILWDDYENLLMSLLMTDYDYDTTDFEYPPGSVTPWTGYEYHEVLWGKAVDDILSAADVNDHIIVENIDGWGQVLLSLVSVLDATSTFKVSPLWTNDEDANTSYPTVLFDTTGDKHCDDETWRGMSNRGYSEDDDDHFYTTGYAGVVSYVSAGSMALSSFYAGEPEINVTYGGRKWFTYGLDERETIRYNLTTSMLKDANLNPNTPFSGVTEISQERLVIEGVREYVNPFATTDVDTYTLHLVTASQDMGAIAGQTIVVAVHWKTPSAADRIYTDPNELFVVLEDRDNSGVFESYSNGPLGLHLAPQYLVGNAYDFIDREPADKPSQHLEWLLESLSGLVFGFLESFPIITEMWNMVIEFIGQGMSTVLGVAVDTLRNLFTDLAAMLFQQTSTSTYSNLEYMVSKEAIDPLDGTLRDDGRVLIDSATGLPSRTGDKYKPWGIEGNGLDDDYDQKTAFWLKILDLLFGAFRNFDGDISDETEGVQILADGLLYAFNNMPVTLWRDVDASEYSLDPNDKTSLSDRQKKYSFTPLGGGNAKKFVVNQIGSKELPYNVDTLRKIYNAMWLPDKAQLEYEDIVGLFKRMNSAVTRTDYEQLDFSRFSGLAELLYTLEGVSIPESEGNRNFDELWKNSIGSVFNYDNAQIVQGEITEGVLNNPIFWGLTGVEVITMKDVLFGYIAQEITTEEGTIMGGQNALKESGMNLSGNWENTLEGKLRLMMEMVIAGTLEQFRDEYVIMGAAEKNVLEAVAALHMRDWYSAMELVVDFGGLKLPILSLWLQDMLYDSFINENIAYKPNDVLLDTGTTSEYTTEKSDIIGEEELAIGYQIDPTIDLVTIHNNEIPQVFLNEEHFNEYYATKELPTFTIDGIEHTLSWDMYKDNIVYFRKSSTAEIIGRRSLLANEYILQVFRSLPQVTNNAGQTTIELPLDSRITSVETLSFGASYKAVPKGQRVFESQILRKVLVYENNDEFQRYWNDLQEAARALMEARETQDVEIIRKYQEIFDKFIKGDMNKDYGLMHKYIYMTKSEYDQFIKRQYDSYEIWGLGTTECKVEFRTSFVVLPIQERVINAMKLLRDETDRSEIDKYTLMECLSYDSHANDKWTSYNDFFALDLKQQIYSAIFEDFSQTDENGNIVPNYSDLTTGEGSPQPKIFDTITKKWYNNVEEIALKVYGTEQTGSDGKKHILPSSLIKIPNKEKYVSLSAYLEEYCSNHDDDGRYWSVALGRPIKPEDHKQYIKDRWDISLYVPGEGFCKISKMTSDQLAQLSKYSLVSPEGETIIKYFLYSVDERLSYLSLHDPENDDEWTVDVLDEYAGYWRWCEELNRPINIHIARKLGLVNIGTSNDAVREAAFQFLTCQSPAKYDKFDPVRMSEYDFRGDDNNVQVLHLTHSVQLNGITNEEISRIVPTIDDKLAWDDILKQYEKEKTGTTEPNTGNAKSNLELLQRLVKNSPYFTLKESNQSKLMVKTKYGMNGMAQLLAALEHYIKSGFGTTEADPNDLMNDQQRRNIMATFNALLPLMVLPHDIKKFNNLFESSMKLASVINLNERTIANSYEYLTKHGILSSIYLVDMAKIGYQTVVLLHNKHLSDIPFSIRKYIALMFPSGANEWISVLQYPYRRMDIDRQIRNFLDPFKGLFLDSWYAGFNLNGISCQPTNRWQLLPPILKLPRISWKDTLLLAERGITFDLTPQFDIIVLSQKAIEFLSIVHDRAMVSDVILSKKLQISIKYVRRIWQELMQNQLLVRMNTFQSMGFNTNLFFFIEFDDHEESISLQNFQSIITHLKFFTYSSLFYSNKKILVGDFLLPASWISLLSSKLAELPEIYPVVKISTHIGFYPIWGASYGTVRLKDTYDYSFCTKDGNKV